MAIPPEFNEAEHLQEICRFYINKLIREDFKDLNSADGNWEPTITTSRASMRHGLTHKDSDNLLMTLTRLMIYYFTFGKAKDLQANIYGLPSTSFHDAVTFLPQVLLFFREDMEDVEDGYSPIDSEITFRLVGETPSSYSEAKATTLGNKIKSLFGGSTPFTWKRGREKVLYLDKELGYDFRLLAFSEAEGKKVIEQVLDIHGHTPDWSKQSLAVARRNFPIVPPTKNILGKARKMPRDRPIGTVKYRWAELKIHGIPSDIILHDTTGYWRNALVKD